MIRLKELKEKLFNVVGWEDGYGDNRLAYASFMPNPAESESGLTYQGAHPLCTLDNVRSIMPADWNSQYPEFTSAHNWWEGQKCWFGGKLYICRDGGYNDSPADEPENWLLWNPLNDFLVDITEKAIVQTIQNFLTMKQLTEETRDLFDRHAFFDGAARLQATIRSSHQLVGFELVPVRAMGVTLQINRIGLQMIGATGRLTMYLFHSSQVEPIKTIYLHYTNTSGGFQWFEMEGSSAIYLPYMGSKTDTGGAWYLCYHQDDLPTGMEALCVTRDWSAEPCGTCNQGNLAVWRQMTKYLQISPFAVTVSDDFISNPQMWDVEKMIYTPMRNYGINCEVTVGCDLTDFIIEQRAMFATVLQKQVAATVLRRMAMNPDVRVNRNQSNVSRMDVLYELDGNTQSNRPGGLGHELKEAYKALSLNLKGLDRMCLKCHNGGVKYRTA